MSHLKTNLSSSEYNTQLLFTSFTYLLHENQNRYIPYRILIPHMISLLFIVAWAILRYKIIGYTTIEFTTDEERAIARKILDKDKDDHKNHLRNTTTLEDSFNNFMTLPTSLKRKVLMVELVDILLLFACVPTCYLFYIGWKWI